MKNQRLHAYRTLMYECKGIQTENADWKVLAMCDATVCDANC